MGTRGFVGYKVDGKVIVQYQQFDSYIAGVGLTFISEMNDLVNGISDELVSAHPELKSDKPALAERVREEIRARLRRIRKITDRTKITPAIAAKYAHLGGEDPNVRSGAIKDTAPADLAYWLLRPLQGHLGLVIQEGVILAADKDWPRDSLFCEWGYLLNMDADGGLGTLEIYRGFQTSPPTAGEWVGTLPTLDEQYEWVGNVRKTIGRKRSKYHPVNLVASFSVIEPPTVEQVAELGERLSAEEDAAYEAEVLAGKSA